MHAKFTGFPTKSAAIRQAVETQKDWIERQLGGPLVGIVRAFLIV